jgi:hypothetical protein
VTLKNNKPRLQVIVQEKEEPQFVCNLSREEVETLTDRQLEEMAKVWCGQMGYTYVDYTEA